MKMPVQDLRGPHADEACHVLAQAISLTSRQAVQISEIYNTDDDDTYAQHCTEVWNALERTGRLLPLGWFEAIFVDCTWVEETLALHAIADSVMATLVRTEISREAYNRLTLPFLVGRTLASENPAKVDLANDKAMA